ncbi:hypothetical protein E4U38_004601 [Claviceps purpurea]|nr:hypothetical protein E4U38_004601 [Claviceps purpurea]
MDDNPERIPETAHIEPQPVHVEPVHLHKKSIKSIFKKEDSDQMGYASSSNSKQDRGETSWY